MNSPLISEVNSNPASAPAAATPSSVSAVASGISATGSNLTNSHETIIDQGKQGEIKYENDDDKQKTPPSTGSSPSTLSPSSSPSTSQHPSALQQQQQQPQHQHQHQYQHQQEQQQQQSYPSNHSYQPSYTQPHHRSAPTSPYYNPRPSSSHTKSFNGQQGQGPGIHNLMAVPPGAVPTGHGYGIPPPFYSPVNSIPQSPGSRRGMIYPGQLPSTSGSHPLNLPGGGRHQQYHAPNFKQPYLNQNFPPDYQHPGYYVTADGWQQAHASNLQKKPKELDKAMWVGNVLSDTTMAELQAIFETEPTEEEGDIQHDIPESIFILSKSNCAFVNYSSHEAVDRSVHRFHDREFKNTRLVCRPRKDPVTDPFSKKLMSPNRYPQQQPQQTHHGQSPYMSDDMGYYGSDTSLPSHRLNENENLSQRGLAEAQTRMERMRLEASPQFDGSSSGGEGSIPGQAIRRNKGNSKKSRSASSLGYSESRYFILKSLTEEDLKLSVQYGLWATQDHLVPILNEAFMNSKNVFLVFSANKSGEFFGYARMMETISTENETLLTTTRKEDDIWQPAIEIPLSPEMKAKMVEEIDQAAKEGRQITNEDAEKIARASTTTKSWGIRFPVNWMHVHKVPFSRTSHMLNSLYENREVKVSKDGTEVDQVVGEQLLSLFKKSSQNRRGRSSVRDSGSRSNSEAGESSRSSVAGESNSLAPPQSQRSASSRRSSIMSTRSTGSTGDRRASLDPSRTQGSGNKTVHSPLHGQNRSQFGGDGGQPQHRSSSRHNQSTSQSNNYTASAYGPYSTDHQYHEQSRPGWNSKSNYKGGNSGYGHSPMSGGPGQGGFHHQDHGQNQRKTGVSGKYGPSTHLSPLHGGYDSHQLYHTPHGARRQPQSQYTNPYRSGNQPPIADHSQGAAGFIKHDTERLSPGNSSSTLSSNSGAHDHGEHSTGSGSKFPPSNSLPPGAHGVSPAQHNGQHIPPHPSMYSGQVPPGGYHAPFPPPGYPIMPPYIGYPYMPGPAPFIHGAVAWHPGQAPHIPAGLVPGHPTSIPPMHGPNGVGGEGHGMEGMVPLIAYDGVAYAYIPADESYHQAMFSYGGYIPHGHQVSDEADNEVGVDSQDVAQDTEAKREDAVENGSTGDIEATSKDSVLALGESSSEDPKVSNDGQSIITKEKKT
ncbi:hypothetical protein BGZ76_001435 [Entomortierella beljakovae]|nr:hypothetical protein BGZ76_001435 [Entomortierella beljakovae]